MSFYERMFDMKEHDPIRVMELFAGVGGFHLGFKKVNDKFNKDLFKVVWANQWEPSRKSQEAFECYKYHFADEFESEEDIVNEDIAKVPDEVFTRYKPDLVVGGFPCQDYSVARSLSGEKGIEGKKGVLFWEIKRVLENTHAKYVLLENVDRLLKSPSKQRGRDFAIMLATFRNLGYSVEWRVINAADYGHAQRRRRVFIFAYKNHLPFAKMQEQMTMEHVIFKDGFFARKFPVHELPYNGRINSDILPDDIVDISDNYSFNFFTAGVMIDGKFTTAQVTPNGEEPKPLRDIILQGEVDEKYYLTPEQEEKFKFLRGPKKIPRTGPNGVTYYYSEGGMSPTDDLDKPGRTMLTSEGTVNRSSHIIEINGRKRFLTPLECERLNEFDDGWTDTGMSDRMRYFCMGNALVVGLIEKMGERLLDVEEINNEKAIKFDDVESNSETEADDKFYVQLTLDDIAIN